mmetsp:Transcript_17787/g.21751  ORF Transcript_17787/g.21751 Transcript_17787/m.21751 type:complete len:130 (-) Transcript_17787:663-1052(-)
MQLHIISSHHLLNHAPDNFLSKGSKYKLHGVYRFGTPGLAFCIGDMVDVENFQAAMEKKMPQKKFDIIMSRECDMQMNGWEEASMDQLRELLTPDEFTDILKIQGTANTGSNNNNSSSKGKSQKGKKKK